MDPAAAIRYRVRIEAGRSFLTADPAGSFAEALTTFRQPLPEIAAHIAEVLDEDDPEVPQIRRFPAQVIWRKTVRP